MALSSDLQTDLSAQTRAPTDLELLERFEQGDRSAFEKLFARYRGPLFRFVLRFLHDEEASRDAVQDVFLKVLRDPSRFEARSRFSTWLHSIARNLCLDMLRKRRIRNHPSLSQPVTPEGPPLVEVIASNEPPVDLEAERRPLRLKLLVAIRALPIEQRQVFLLREVAGLTFTDIARSLGIPANTAKSRMRYALHNLRRAALALGLRPDSTNDH